jgi:LEA14-like dessication related protein
MPVRVHKLEINVEKLTRCKINLIMQHKMKNLDLLADTIHDIRTEQICDKINA